MSKKSDLLNSLFQYLAPALLGRGFERADDASGFVIFSRSKPEYYERIGFLIGRSQNSQGCWSFGVICGLEFHELHRCRNWLGMPYTHCVKGLEGLVRKPDSSLPRPPREFQCANTTDYRQLAAQLETWLEEAFRVMATKMDKLRASHVSFVDAMGKIHRHCLAVQKDELPLLKGRRKMPTNSRLAAIPPLKWNVFEIALKLLRSRGDHVERLEVRELGPLEIGDRQTCDRLRDEFVQATQEIQTALEVPLPPADDFGSTENDILPIRGVLRFVNWRVGSKWLYVAATHAGQNAPFVLLLGASMVQPCQVAKTIQTTPIEPILPVPSAAQSAPRRERTTTIRTRVLKVAKKLLAKEQSASEEIMCWEFGDDSESHDRSICEQLYSTAEEVRTAALAALRETYGDPSNQGTSQCRDIPHNGILAYTIWRVGNRRLFLITAHEDTELPIELIVGTFKTLEKDGLGKKKVSRTKKSNA